MTEDPKASGGDIVGSSEPSMEPSISFQDFEITGSQVQGEQRPFAEELTDQGIKTRTVLHEQYLERIKAEHDLEQQSQENRGRRLRENITYGVVIGAIVVGLVFSAILSIWITDDETRRWAQSFVTFSFGGVLGGLAGYFTGKRD